jgi:hypothetical protein
MCHSEFDGGLLKGRPIIQDDTGDWGFLAEEEDYQLAFLTPGIKPWLAISRKQIRERPN